MNLSSPCLRISQLTLIASALLFAGCGSAPTPKQSSQPPTRTVQQPDIISEQTPAELLAEARLVWQQHGNADRRNTLLLDAAARYLQQGETSTAQNILLSLKRTSLSTSQLARANLYIAQAYMNKPTVEEDELLALLSPLAEDDAVRQQQLALKSQLYEQQHQWLAAADALTGSREPSAELVAQVWEWVNAASDQQRRDAEHRFPSLRPYLALHDLAATSGMTPSALNRALQQFNQVYRGHPLTEFIPQEITAATRGGILKPDEIVVLLPLSGKLAATGTTVKEGLLSAYYQNNSGDSARRAPVKLHFVDTVNKTADEMLSAISGYKWVIGPLLKENVDAIIDRVPADTYMLALNRADFDIADSPINTSSLLDNSNVKFLADITEQASDSLAAKVRTHAKHAFFALAPEDEATQLADYIYQHGFKTPIVVSSRNSVNQRMEAAFNARWQTLNENRARNQHINLTKVEFTDSNSLREGITEALDVAQSRQRIRQIEYMVNEKLYNVPRNRRDVDAIIVFASPEQTELLNPMVEASLSPFNGHTVPVFATSRSIEYDDTKNQWRDLQNVRFLDMPWMMPDNQWADMRDHSHRLWPQRNTQMSRLFAFGVDAYNLLPHVPAMMTLPQLKVNGLTGTLQINAKGEVIRTLPQAIINNEAVKRVSDDKIASTRS